jgi:hypothetical protein
LFSLFPPPRVLVSDKFLAFGLAIFSIRAWSLSKKPFGKILLKKLGPYLPSNEFFDCVAWFGVPRFSAIPGCSDWLSRRGCGNCGKLDVLGRVFQALWERWKNAVCFSTVSIARQFP